MNVLITGSSGFLGQSLAGQLTSSGHQVTLLGRRQPPSAVEAITVIKADISNLDELKSAAEQAGQVDCVVHLAALVPKTKDEDLAPAMNNINVGGTINLLEVFGSKLKNFVYASTAEVYGLPEIDKVIDETVLPKPLSFYGASKLAGELFCQVYAQRLQIPIAMLRFSVMYGPGDKIKRAVPNFIGMAIAGKDLEVFGGEELRDYLYVDDAIQALALASTDSASGVYNVGTGKGISIKDTAEAIIKKVGSSSKVKILQREKKASDIVLDIKKIQTELNFKPRYSFPDKLEEQIKWHAQNSK